MTAYDWASLLGVIIGAGIGVAVVRNRRNARRTEPPDPQCANLDSAGHRCVLMTGHPGEHQVLAVYRRSAAD